MRLIDADALLEDLQFSLPVFNETAKIIVECVKILGEHIQEAPTIEAEPVRHGRWEHSASMVLSAKCSECRMWITKHSVNEPDFRYCPHCRAKMDGDEHDTK